LFAAGMLAFVWLFPHTEAYTMAFEQLTKNPAAIEELGTPITGGFPSGHVTVSDDRGSAELSFSAMGPKGHGIVNVDARKNFGVWRLERLDLMVEGRDRPIDLLPKTPRKGGLPPE
jgi:hypothetical protein